MSETPDLRANREIHMKHSDTSELLEASLALQRILRHCRPGASVRRTLAQAAGGFLAQEIRATHPSPPFNQSHVDGYGILLADVRKARKHRPVSLPLVATIRAGDLSSGRLTPGHTVKIFTGAPVPGGVEAIVMRERCAEDHGRVLFFCGAKSGDHIRYRGEEFRRNSVVLRTGERLSPPAIGLLASLGYRDARVYDRPRVALLTTGNELIKPGRPLRPGQVYECNAAALTTAIRGLGISGVRTVHARDAADALRRSLLSLMPNHDVVISVGGVSVGDYDLVRDAAEEAGVRRVFWRVAVKPGMPLYFGVFSQKISQDKIASLPPRSSVFFGLPGNPVSALVTFHQFVRPALLRMLGQKVSQRFLIPVQLGASLRKKPGRLEWVRGRLEFGGKSILARPVPGQQSHMLGGLTAANALIEFPAALAHLSRNSRLMAELLNWM